MQQYAKRDNLFAADNQQGRPETEPSTTTRTAPRKPMRKHRNREGYRWNPLKKRWVRIITDNTAFCCDCSSWKRLSDFSSVNDRPYQYCKACQRLHKAMSRYKITREQAAELYSITTCQCCGAGITKKQHQHIHHVGDSVIGLVCLKCNHTLRDESIEHYHRLKSCVKFIESRMKI